MATKFGGQAKKLAVEEDEDGYRPIHRFYSTFKEKFSDYNFLNMLNTW